GQADIRGAPPDGARFARERGGAGGARGRDRRAYAPGAVVRAVDLRRRRYPRSLRRRGRRATRHAHREAGMSEVAQPNEHGTRIQQAKKPRKGARFLQIVAKPARPIRRKTKHKLTRVTFTASRLMEFCTKRKLQNQTGHSVYDWPLVVLKELMDNA